MSILSAAIAVWGWQTGLWFFALPMILIFEGRRLIRARWSFSLSDLKNVLKLCGGIAGVILLFLLIKQPSGLIFSLIQGLPVCAFPLIAANAYSDKGLSFLLHLLAANPRHLQQGVGLMRSSIDLYTPYFALCLLSASATNIHGVEFYVATAALVAVMLWHNRSRQFNPALWICLMLLASGIGFIGHLQLHQFQARLEQQAAPWLSGLNGELVDSEQTSTHIGSFDDLKQSNAIVFRVAGSHDNFPLLLREATYNRYGAASWTAAQSKFTPVASRDRNTWDLAPAADSSTSITVSESLNGRPSLLKLPNGTSTLSQLSVDQLSQNQYGTVKVEGDQKEITYQVQFNPQQSADGPPTENDLTIPAIERPAVQKILETFNRSKQSDAAFLEAVRSYFTKNFRYSLSGAQRNSSLSPLSDFLLKQRSGHCEYFASATTLLLREAGIPARYAVGYAVSEFSPFEKQYIVRSRHAHAWTMAYLNGAWQSFDTTPPDWTAQEDAAASSLQFLSDLWAFLSFKIVNAQGVHLLWLIAPVAAFGMWKSRGRLRLQPAREPESAPSEPAALPIQAGIDSEFYLVMQKLNTLHLQRQAAESTAVWLKRLQRRLTAADFETLDAILQLHFRYRFDPLGLGPEERESLKALCRSWLDTVKNPQTYSSSSPVYSQSLSSEKRAS